MARRPAPLLDPTPLGFAFFAGLWSSSAIAYVTRFERFSTLFAAVGMALLTAGLGAVLLTGAEVFRQDAARRRA